MSDIQSEDGSKKGGWLRTKIAEIAPKHAASRRPSPFSRTPFSRTYGFTLIELLVVTAMIGALISLLIPAVQSSRAAARRVQCFSQLRQLGLAAHAYHAANGEFPPGLEQRQVRWSPQYRGNSLFTFLLPHFEQGHLLSRWDYDAPLNNTVGGRSAPSAAVIPLLTCPADTIPTNPVAVAGRYFGVASYGGNGGSRSYPASQATCDGMFHTTGPASQPRPNQSAVRMSSVTDGASHTILFGERGHADPNLESFAEAYWAESLTYLGRWAAIGGRKRIGDVTMSAATAINYQIPFPFSRRGQGRSQLTNPLAFEAYEQLRKCAFGSSHPRGACFAFTDGSARFLDESLDRRVLEATCSRGS